MRCRCDGHYTDNWHRWRVLARGENGGSSKLYCLDCRAEWSSKAKYIVLLKDHAKRSRTGLTDQSIIELIRRGVYLVETENAIVRNANGQPLAIVTREHKDGPQRGTYRFVNLCFRGQKKKVALHRLVWMAANDRTVPDGFHVDHVHNQQDDSINNLRLLEAGENIRRGSADKEKESEVPF